MLTAEEVFARMKAHALEGMVFHDEMVRYFDFLMELQYLRRVRHRCGFAIALKRQYWNAGLGTAMMGYALSLARDMGYEQVELEVVEGNERAKRLYEKMGFVETGRTLRSLRYDDGSYRDEICMAKIL